MEYMRIEGFLGNAISKMINKGIENKFGYKPGISVDHLGLKTIDKHEVDLSTDTEKTEGDLVVLDIKVSMTQADFNKLIEEATK